MLSADRLLGALVLVKAVDVLDRGAGRLPGPLWTLVLVAWALGGLALVAVPQRRAWATVLVAGAALAYDFPTDLRRQHLVLFLGVALAAVVAVDERERLLLWRVQLTVLYGVAVLAKLNESYLTGNVVAQAVQDGPLGLEPAGLALLVAASVALLGVELALAVLVWVRPREGALLAVALHGAVLVLVPPDGHVLVRLVFFGGTAVVLWAACAGALRAAPDSVRA